MFKKVIEQMCTRAQAWEISALGIEEREQKKRITGHSSVALTLQEVHRVLGTIVERPWFFRVWVLQEVALARKRTVIIGQFRLRWDALVEAERYLHGNALFKSALMRSSGAGSKVQQMGVIRDLIEEDVCVPLVRLMTFTHSSYCADPRDRLYCILGLFQERDLTGLVIDYESSESEVIGRGFETLLHQNPESLTLASLQSTDLPSWFPDLAIHQNGNLSLFRPKMRRIDATNGSTSSFVFDYSNRTLTVQGRIIDRVSVTGVKLQLHPRGDLAGNGTLHGFTRIYREQETVAMVTEAWVSFLRSTLLPEDHQKNPTVIPGLYVTGENLTDAFIATVTAGTRIIVDFWAEVLRMSVDRRFFVTDKLLMGTGPVSEMEYDVVAIFCGQLTPYVLRPKGGGYRIVGACYVQDIMAGKAMPQYDADLYDLASTRSIIRRFLPGGGWVSSTI